MSGKTSRFSGTSAMPRRTTAAEDAPVMSRPSKVTEPRRGRSRPAIVIRSVVLPAPFGPSTQVIRPSGTEMSTPFRASIMP